MPHKIRRKFDESLTFEKIYEAHLRARKHKTSREELIKFELSLENNLTNLLNNLKRGRYMPGKYSNFIVYEPKKRTIMSLPYVDRIVHQWYVENFIKPYIVPRFISTTYACIKDRGTHKAVDKLQEYMRKKYRENEDFWVLKCDIKKFFYSIDKNILFNIMKKYIEDKKLLSLTKTLIYSRLEADEKGIPIGNYTSQFFANIYLNELDQYAKHVLHLKYYVRYMDDFIIILDTKEECKEVKRQIETFLDENLKLELNHKSKYYPHRLGINFCGYITFTTHKRLRKDSKKKIKRKVTKYNKLYKNNELDFPRAIESITSWIGHASHSNSYTLVNSIIQKCDFLYNQRIMEIDEKYLIDLILYNKWEE